MFLNTWLTSIQKYPKIIFPIVYDIIIVLKISALSLPYFQKHKITTDLLQFEMLLNIFDDVC